MSIFRSLWACLVLSLLMPLTPLKAADADILGIELGMDVNTVRQILVDQGMQISERHAYHTYSDGVDRNIRTEIFLKSLAGQSQGEQILENIEVIFSEPPQSPRVMYLSRSSVYLADPPSAEQLLAALTGKYGDSDLQQGGMRVWLRPPGAKACYHGFQGYRTYHPESPKQSDISSLIFRTRSHEHFRNPLVNSVDECAAYIVYSFSGTGITAVRGYDGLMADVQGIYKNNQETSSWLNSLSEEATKKRLEAGSGSSPRL